MLNTPKHQTLFADRPRCEWNLENELDWTQLKKPHTHSDLKVEPVISASSARWAAGTLLFVSRLIHPVVDAVVDAVVDPMVDAVVDTYVCVDS